MMIFFNAALIISLATSAVLISGLPTNNEDKRSGTVGLYPFPRVGRSQSWLYPAQDYTRFPRGSRGKNSGLISQPRVGRSQPEKTWSFSSEDYPDYHSAGKRQGLIPFPRVGRTFYEQIGSKRSNGEATSGMWFGPRLGRFSKKNVDSFEEDEPWTMIALREVSRSRDFTPRLGRESDELQADDDQLLEKSEMPEDQEVRQKRQSQ